MKNRIIQTFPNSKFGKSCSTNIFVADFSKRTNKSRGVEISDNVPSDPNDEKKEMECLDLCNPDRMIIDYNIFEDDQFKDEKKKYLAHCECCLFPSENNDKTWVAFIEIKDCKFKNMSVHINTAKEQIISTVDIFRSNGIVNPKQNIYGLISFPRRNKLCFDQTIFEDYTVFKKMYKGNKIHLMISNTVTVNDSNKLIITDEQDNKLH